MFHRESAAFIKKKFRSFGSSSRETCTFTKKAFTQRRHFATSRIITPVNYGRMNSGLRSFYLVEVQNNYNKST